MNLKWIGLALAVTTGLAHAQGVAQPPKPEFEVASIKPNQDCGSRTLVQVLPGGGLRTSCATLKFLLFQAYDVQSFQISGGPSWMNSSYFDVIAKAESPAGSESEPNDPSKISKERYKSMQELMRPKLQSLLADRFQLRLHRETREEPVYALVAARSGSKLRQSSDFHGLHMAKGQWKGNGATLAMLTAALAGQLGRPVLDRTGLKGAFDFNLEWTPDVAQANVSPPSSTNATSPSDSSGPSIFTALQEQLGLKLESAKGPVEVLVIDHVELPSLN